ncbi:MAG TPA: hypothetical protein PLQ93_05020 [Bacteroidia bacterium]|nr:hypothetical protein [Bacteroidia bacterium]
MKIIFSVAAICLALFLISCKKTRECQCTVTTSGTTTTLTQIPGLADTSIVVPLNTTNQNTVTMYKVTKKKAKFNCFDKAENINETTDNSIPGLATIKVTNSGTRTYNCTIK